MASAEYYVARIVGKTSMKSAEKEAFTVTKFEGGDTPTGVYLVVWNKVKDQMECECPNKRRGAHIDDKHGEVVREWLAAGEPQRAFSATPQPKQRPEAAYKKRYSENDPDDDTPF